MNIDLHQDLPSSDSAIGVLCLLDDVAHDFTHENLQQLKNIAVLLAGQIVQQIEEQHARRQARMHQVTIAFTNKSLQLLNTEESGMFNTAHVSLPIRFPVLDENGSIDRDAESQFTSFVTPQPLSQKLETTL